MNDNNPATISVTQESLSPDYVSSDDEPLSKLKKITSVNQVCDGFDESKKAQQSLKEQQHFVSTKQNAEQTSPNGHEQQTNTISIRNDSAEKMAFVVKLNELLANFHALIGQIGIGEIAPKTFLDRYNDLRKSFSGISLALKKVEPKFTKDFDELMTKLKHQIARIFYYFERILQMMQLDNLR